MTTTAIATVMSALRKPRCSLDVFHPCIRDGLGAKSPLDPASCGLDTATVPRDTSYPTGKTPSPAGKISPHSDESNPQRETSEAGQTGLRFQRGEPIPSSRQDDHIHIISARSYTRWIQHHIDALFIGGILLFWLVALCCYRIAWDEHSEAGRRPQSILPI